MKISISSPEFVADPYTGTRGLYVATTPTDETAEFLSNLASLFGYIPDRGKFHVTVMYAPEKYPQPGPWMTIDKDQEFTGLFSRCQHWDGNDGKGYLSARLHSVDLQSCHRKFIAQGCKHTFTPYEPHVTLWSGVPRTIDLSNKMASVQSQFGGSPVSLTFKGLIVADIKKD